ncbi:ABC transporter permease [candidate division KSB1 bacterium]
MRKISPPKVASRILQSLSMYEELFDITLDLKEVFYDMAEEKGSFIAYLWFWMHTLKSLWFYLIFLFQSEAVMFKNYLKIAVRNLMRKKVHSFINISGLAVGLASCLLILLYIRFELSYDTYHKDAERIFRIAFKSITKYGIHELPSVPLPLLPVIEDNCPLIEYGARLSRSNSSIVIYEDKTFYEERCWFAGKAVFDILSVRIIVGDPSSALERADAVLLSENMSEKYFGGDDPIGKNMSIDGKYFTVSGVLENPRENSHMKFDFVASLASQKNDPAMTNWASQSCKTYIKLKESVDPAEVEFQINRIANDHINIDETEDRPEVSYYLQPVSDIHLYSNLFDEAEAPGNPTHLYIFSVVCFLILITAWINYVNLSMVRSAERVKEVGMRKVAGATRRQLLFQFLNDSLLISLIAVIIAVIIVNVALPYFNDLIGLDLLASGLLDPVILLLLFCFVVFTGLFAGSFPAIFLSGFDIVSILKGKITTRFHVSFLHKLLVVGQFSISIILIICTVMVYKQLSFMKEKSLGFEKEQILIIPTIPGESLYYITDKLNIIRNEFQKHPAVTGVAFSSNIPGGVRSGIYMGDSWERENSRVNHEVLYVDFDFIPLYNIKMAAGRFFQREYPADTVNGMVINETASKALGFNSADKAVGQEIKGIGRSRTVLGVAKDFHFEGLQSEVRPLAMKFYKDYLGVINLKIQIGNISETLSDIKNQWYTLFPGIPFSYFFLDTQFDRQYNSEEKLGRIFGVFTFLGLFIACMGLFGFASLITERRTKEVGIRKVLGSTAAGVVALLSKEFCLWVLVSNIIAYPIAYFVVFYWLQNFAYTININIGLFVMTSLITLLIAMLTVGFKTIKFAYKNPVDSLRYE